MLRYPIRAARRPCSFFCCINRAQPHAQLRPAKGSKLTHSEWRQAARPPPISHCSYAPRVGPMSPQPSSLQALFGGPSWGMAVPYRWGGDVSPTCGAAAKGGREAMTTSGKNDGRRGRLCCCHCRCCHPPRQWWPVPAVLDSAPHRPQSHRRHCALSLSVWLGAGEEAGTAKELRSRREWRRRESNSGQRVCQTRALTQLSCQRRV